jgi:circadian clock protein KaiB
MSTENDKSLSGNQGKAILRLYVADETNPSKKAIANLESICREYLCDNYTIDIVDILKDPIRALSEGVLVTPALVRLSPLPVRRIVGDLSDKEAVLFALNLGKGHHEEK